MLNERPEGKDKFGYVLIGLLVAFVIILVTSAVIMSFTSLTSHVILLMLVSWMGAELLASGNRMIRRVFGKLSVLLGMYALTCLLIDVSNLTHGHTPFIGLPVSGIMLCGAILYSILFIGGHGRKH